MILALITSLNLVDLDIGNFIQGDWTPENVDNKPKFIGY